MSDPLTYWQSGGDLLRTGGVAMDEADAVALYDLHVDEALAAARAGARPAEQAARRLARQIDEALKGAARWRRAASGVFAGSRPDGARQRRSA